MSIGTFRVELLGNFSAVPAKELVRQICEKIVHFYIEV